MSSPARDLQGHPATPHWAPGASWVRMLMSSSNMDSMARAWATARLGLLGEQEQRWGGGPRACPNTPCPEPEGALWPAEMQPGPASVSHSSSQTHLLFSAALRKGLGPETSKTCEDSGAGTNRDK